MAQSPQTPYLCSQKQGMNNGSLVFVPSGGLANRMRAMASACELGRRTGVAVRVVWFQDWALRAPYAAIFEPCPELSVREARPLDYLLHDRPRRRNLWLPRPFQQLLFDQRIDEPEVTPLKRQGFDFDAWASGRRSYMSCYQEFGTFPDAVYTRLFRPARPVAEAVASLAARFSPHTVGFHIRRTDNAESIRQSPLQLFVEAGRREVAAHADTRIFLATDDEPTKRELQRLFGDRLVVQAAPADRDSTEGIRGGLVDMYALAATGHVYGSAGSSFSVMASRLGGCPLTVLRQ